MTRVWARAWLGVAGVGAGVACLALGPGLTVALWLVVSLAAGLLLRLSAVPTSLATNGAQVWFAVLTEAAAVGLGFVGLCGFSVLSPGLTFLIVTVAVATSHPVRVFVHRLMSLRSLGAGSESACSGDPGAQDTGRADHDLGDPGLRYAEELTTIMGLTNEELCYTWRRTYVLLQQPIDAVATAAVVSTRHICLDEMERRNPAGLQAWLASGARASGSPERFLSASPDGGQHDAA